MILTASNAKQSRHQACAGADSRVQQCGDGSPVQLTLRQNSAWCQIIMVVLPAVTLQQQQQQEQQ
jgi:hypothetical protein